MKLFTTTILAFCLALTARSSAAPAEINTAAAAANTGPKDLSQPHWKKPIPTFSFRAHRTLEAVRTIETQNPLTAGHSSTGPKDLSHPHWKKPIPTFSLLAHRTLEALRTLEARNTPATGSSPTGPSPTDHSPSGPSPTGPSRTAGPPVPGFPSDGERSWGVRPQFSIVTDIRPERGAIM
ncbi:MAG: hypothetical protein FRX48_05574 [Lasallia pustulata]|uniref:Uncharacterized protein n=1 Tax=Lasallia pustulata TaxID=136370 RepID=A0A5M8PMG1_9LECA|nr:MAG: hypothetical protein FRX48_05574 [Lasallia pustulata]